MIQILAQVTENGSTEELRQLLVLARTLRCTIVVSIIPTGIGSLGLPMIHHAMPSPTVAFQISPNDTTTSLNERREKLRT